MEKHYHNLTIEATRWKEEGFSWEHCRSFSNFQLTHSGFEGPKPILTLGHLSTNESRTVIGFTSITYNHWPLLLSLVNKSTLHRTSPRNFRVEEGERKKCLQYCSVHAIVTSQRESKTKSFAHTKFQTLFISLSLLIHFSISCAALLREKGFSFDNFLPSLTWWYYYFPDMNTFASFTPFLSVFLLRRFCKRKRERERVEWEREERE